MEIPQDAAWQEVKQELGNAFKIVLLCVVSVCVLAGVVYGCFSLTS